MKCLLEVVLYCFGKVDPELLMCGKKPFTVVKKPFRELNIGGLFFFLLLITFT